MRALMKDKIIETKKMIILEGLSRYFEQESFSGATIYDIAKFLNLSVGFIYKLFSSKDELYYAYLVYEIEQFYHHLCQECQKIDNPHQCLVIFTKKKIEIFLSKRRAIDDVVLSDPLFFTKLNTPRHNAAKPLMELLTLWFDRLAIKGYPSFQLAYMFHGMVNGIVECWMNGGDVPHDPEGIVNAFLKGLEWNA